ncbi:hypothetical protein D5086_019113 [Populus alba]|uniref:Uncharacterized protein n=1 Tax=Populus alba TaxID=43335 RepID=A0ACC4BGN6_POPAL
MMMSTELLEILSCELKITWMLEWLHIVGEVKFAGRHCLLVDHGVKVEELRVVLNHPQALAKCENTLTKLGLITEAVDDTAGAAKVA